MTCNECDKRAMCKKPCEAIEKVLSESGCFGTNWEGKRNSRHKDFNSRIEIPFSSLPENIKMKLLMEGKMGWEFFDNKSKKYFAGRVSNNGGYLL